jgi:hypothetical protein
MSTNVNPNIGKQLYYLQEKYVVSAEKVPKKIVLVCIT